MAIIGRLFNQPTGSFFLFGPRGTGKSTWLKDHYPDAIWVDLLSPENHRRYLAKPERLKEIIAATPRKEVVVIDEVQKVPALLDVVHELIEKEKKLRFILTGSSARKLRRGASNLLAGRLSEASLHPFLAAELKDQFKLEDSLRFGLVPLVTGSENALETIQAYASLYLREEVMAEGLVRDIGQFSRFLETISLSHGSLLNLSEVARECSVGRKTVEGYLEVLEDLLLGFRLSVFSKRAKRHLIKHKKFYYFDSGVYLSIRPKGPLDNSQEIRGMNLEGLVAQHLRAWIAYGRIDANLYFWRTKSGTEVDFVVYGENVFFAVEVKSTRNLSRKDVKGLCTFAEDYPQAKSCLLYMGVEKIKIKNITCIPCDEFLKGLIPGRVPEF